MFATLKIDKIYNLKLTMKGIKEIENTLNKPIGDIILNANMLKTEQWEEIFIILTKNENPDLTIDDLDNLIENNSDIVDIGDIIQISIIALRESTLLNKEANNKEATKVKKEKK